MNGMLPDEAPPTDSLAVVPKGKQRNTISSRVDGEECTSLEVHLGLENGSTDALAHGLRANILRPNLYDTGFAC